MSRIWSSFILFVVVLIPINTFGQSDEQSNFDKYIQINTEYSQINEKNYMIGSFQPGFALADLKNAHEISLTALQFQKDSISADFNRQTFSAGACYQYRHIIVNLKSRLSFWAGGSIETNYRSTHFEPTRIGPTDVRLKIYDYSLCLNSSISYKVTDKIFIDLDFPYPIWKGMYRNQENTSTDTGDSHRSAERDFDALPKYTFNLIVGIRYRL